MNNMKPSRKTDHAARRATFFAARADKAKRSAEYERKRNLIDAWYARTYPATLTN